MHRTSSAVTRIGPDQWRLEPNGLLSLRHARGCRIECIEGSACITAYDVLADVTLLPGGVFIVPNRRLTLIEGVLRCRIRIAEPDTVLHRLRRGFATSVPRAERGDWFPATKSRGPVSTG